MDNVVFDKPKTEEKSESSLAPWIDSIVNVYKEKARIAKGESGPTINVSQTLSSLALVYEKIRNAVDFRSEHLFRRSATERILRRLWAGNQETAKIAENLIKELIWGRYLKNNVIPQRKINQIGDVIGKYRLLKKYIAPSNHDWILGMLSAEIDEILVDQQEKEVWAEAAISWFSGLYQWGDEIDSEIKKNLLYIAFHRTLVKSDEAIISFHLLSRFYPGWTKNEENTIKAVATQIGPIKKNIYSLIDHPLGNSLFRLVKKVVSPLFILKDALEESKPQNLEMLFENENLLAGEVSRICSLRYQETKDKVRRGITRSIIYIFATKMVFALLLEVPFDFWYYQRLSGTSLSLGAGSLLKVLKIVPIAINTIFPPILMFLVGFLIHTPNEENTKKVIDHIHNFVYSPPSEKAVFYLAKREGKNIWEKFFGLAYLVMFFAMFIFISMQLRRIGFNPVSTIIFFFFVCLVILFGFRVRWSARELIVTDTKESFGETLLNLIALPFLDVGVKLSAGLSKLNFLVFVLDFLIEAPLKSIIEAIGEWSRIIRKKQEEVVEVPFR